MTGFVEYKDPGHLQAGIYEYFKACKTNREWRRPTDSQIDKAIEEDRILNVEPPDLCTDDKHPSIIGLCVALRICENTLIKYGQSDDFMSTVKEAKNEIQSYNVQIGYTGACQFTQFVLKNNFNWKDKREIENTGSSSAPGGVSDFLELLREIKAPPIAADVKGASEK